ncbi:hypothetical protein E4H12_06810 [Candidatus Thorarchaeota archaeon]|jgi:hypothetical protein|nr:MAG: hypothetical protein E4H12_06810 [Candidatus Thorarchaeota archaeon]
MSKETDAYKMAKTIADAPKEQRQSMLAGRLTMISSEPEEQRVQSVKGLVLGMAKLDSKRRSVFQCALAEALTERTEEERHAIFIGRARAGSLVSKEVDTSIYQGIVDQVYNWPNDRRHKIIGGLEKAYDTLKITRPDFPMMLKKAAS